MRTKIYVLCEPDGKIRYVGKTVKRLPKRLSVHLSEARGGDQTHKARWIRSMLSRGLMPTIRLFEEVEGDGSKEEVAWIAYFRKAGVKLTNLTDGGDGTLGWKPSKELRQKMSESHKGQTAWNKGIPRSAETKRKLSEANKGKKQSAETIEKKVRQLRGQKRSAETRRKMSASAKGKNTWSKGRRHSLESRRKMSQALKGKTHSADHRRHTSEAQKGKKLSVETKQKMSESRKRYWANKKR